jgi:adenine phosphoribosyltransferase
MVRWPASLRGTWRHAVAEAIESALEQRIRRRIRDVPDFPQPGILFKDITPVLSDPTLMRDVVGRLAELHGAGTIDVVAGIESRGFIFGAPLALAIGAGFTPIRKPGKLPYRTLRVDYALEYGTDALEAHVDGIVEGQRVLIVDDLLATGGTAAGALDLVRRLGGEVAGVSFVVELAFLAGRARLDGVSVHSIVSYDAGA